MKANPSVTIDIEENQRESIFRIGVVTILLVEMLKLKSLKIKITLILFIMDRLQKMLQLEAILNKEGAYYNRG